MNISSASPFKIFVYNGRDCLILMRQKYRKEDICEVPKTLHVYVSFMAIRSLAVWHAQRKIAEPVFLLHPRLHGSERSAVPVKKNLRQTHRQKYAIYRPAWANKPLVMWSGSHFRCHQLWEILMMNLLGSNLFQL